MGTKLEDLETKATEFTPKWYGPKIHPKTPLTDPWDERYIYLHEIVDLYGQCVGPYISPVNVGNYTIVPWILWKMNDGFSRILP